MKYILLILYRVLQFIFFCILAILAKFWGILWLGKFKYHIKTNLMKFDYNGKCDRYYRSLWDAAVGRVSFYYPGWTVHTRRSYPHQQGYPTVKGKTKLFTYKV